MSHKPPLEVGLRTLTLLDDIPAVAIDPGNHEPRRKATVRKIFDVDYR
ncbi:MAG: hypothetical protein IE925_04875 [Rhodobacterales bacterium]|nr:hypothetical protein [Rhodobacterales bacterium]